MNSRPTPITTRDDEDDRDLAMLAPPTPLALEPLSTEEIARFTAPVTDADEQTEAALEILRKGSEMSLPLDPDAADATVEPADAHLGIRTRNRRRARRQGAPR